MQTHPAVLEQMYKREWMSESFFLVPAYLHCPESFVKRVILLFSVSLHLSVAVASCTFVDDW